jgi:hypothetical protein
MFTDTDFSNGWKHTVTKHGYKIQESGRRFDVNCGSTKVILTRSFPDSSRIASAGLKNGYSRWKNGFYHPSCEIGYGYVNRRVEMISSALSTRQGCRATLIEDEPFASFEDFN